MLEAVLSVCVGSGEDMKVQWRGEMHMASCRDAALWRHERIGWRQRVQRQA